MTESIPQAQTRGRARQEVGLLVQSELEIAGVTESSFVALKKEAEAMAAMEIKSDADLSAIQKVITKGVRLCGTISDAIEPGKKWAHALHKAYTSNENEFTGTVKAIIEPLKAKKAAYVAEKERIEQEALEAQAAAIRQRFVAVESLGWQRRTQADGSDTYELGGTIIPVTDISTADEPTWAVLLKSMEVVSAEFKEKAEAERIAARRAHEEAIMEGQRLAAEKEAIERQQAELKAQQEAFNAKVNEARRSELSSAGAYFQHDTGVWLTAERFIPLDLLHSIDGEAWDSYIAGARETHEKRLKALNEIALQEERVKALKEAGWQRNSDGSLMLQQQSGDGVTMTATVFTQEIDALGNMPQEVFSSRVDEGQAELARRKQVEEARIAAAAVEAEKQRIAAEQKRAQEAEAQRKAALGDTDLWNEWVAGIRSSAPQMSSAIGKHGVERLLEHVESMSKGLLNDLND